MKRASYRDGVDFIAKNDNDGNGDNEEEIQGYATTLMLASMFGTDVGKVARDVARLRRECGYPVGTGPVGTEPVAYIDTDPKV